MNLGDRMKHYEQCSVGDYLVRRCPAILRIDGRAFHSFTRGFDLPWDWRLHWCLQKATLDLLAEIPTAKLAYGQSDEVSILLVDYDSLNTDQWFAGSVQKIISVAASIMTVAFSKAIPALLVNPRTRFGEVTDVDGIELMWSKLHSATFDARVFSIPKDDVTNYFVWRQQDATRNSITMACHVHFSHKDLVGLNLNQRQNLLWMEKNINWNNYPTVQKRGWAAYRTSTLSADNYVPAILVPEEKPSLRQSWFVDLEMPIVTQDRGFIDQFLEQNSAAPVNSVVTTDGV